MAMAMSSNGVDVAALMRDMYTNHLRSEILVDYERWSNAYERYSLFYRLATSQDYEAINLFFNNAATASDVFVSKFNRSSYNRKHDSAVAENSAIFSMINRSKLLMRDDGIDWRSLLAPIHRIDGRSVVHYKHVDDANRDQFNMDLVNMRISNADAAKFATHVYQWNKYILPIYGYVDDRADHADFTILDSVYFSRNSRLFIESVKKRQLLVSFYSLISDEVLSIAYASRINAARAVSRLILDILSVPIAMSDSHSHSHSRGTSGVNVDPNSIVVRYEPLETVTDARNPDMRVKYEMDTKWTAYVGDETGVQSPMTDEFLDLLYVMPNPSKKRMMDRYDGTFGVYELNVGTYGTAGNNEPSSHDSSHGKHVVGRVNSIGACYMAWIMGLEPAVFHGHEGGSTTILSNYLIDALVMKNMEFLTYIMNLRWNSITPSEMSLITALRNNPELMFARFHRMYPGSDGVVISNFYIFKKFSNEALLGPSLMKAPIERDSLAIAGETSQIITLARRSGYGFA